MMTYSKEKGLVEAGVDDGAIRAVHDIWFYMYIAGYFPLLHKAMVQTSEWLNIEWRMIWRRAIARSDQTPRPKPKNPFSVSKSEILASKSEILTSQRPRIYCFADWDI
jgi:hypothetical protein